MQIRAVATSDISQWENLSAEYDGYVKELVGDLTEWYEGNNYSLAFNSYMTSKIAKQEAFMAVDSKDCCAGIIAISKHNNRITFFAISHKVDFRSAAHSLLLCAIKHLDSSHGIFINAIASPSTWIEQHRLLLSSFGFVHSSDSLENGVPVNVFLKSSEIS